MSTAQSFLLFLVVLGAAASLLRLVSRTTPTVPYPVVLAMGGVLIGLIPGVRLPLIGPDLILLAFVPGLVFEASLALDLEEMWRRAVPISLLATVGVFLTVVVVGVPAHLGLGLDWASAFLLGAIVAATDPIAVVNCCASSGRRLGSRRSSKERASSTTAPESPCSLPSLGRSSAVTLRSSTRGCASSS